MAWLNIVEMMLLMKAAGTKGIEPLDERVKRSSAGCYLQRWVQEDSFGAPYGDFDAPVVCVDTQTCRKERWRGEKSYLGGRNKLLRMKALLEGVLTGTFCYYMTTELLTLVLLCLTDYGF